MKKIGIFFIFFFLFCIEPVFALDLPNLHIHVGSLDLKLDEGKYTYGILTSWDKEKIMITASSDAEGVTVEGTGEIPLEENVTYHDLIFTKGEEQTVYHLRITKKEEETYPFDLSKITIFCGVTPVSPKESLTMKIGSNVKNVLVSARILDEDISVEGLGNVKIGENGAEKTLKIIYKGEEFPIHMKWSNDGEPSETHEWEDGFFDKWGEVIGSVIFVLSFLILNKTLKLHWLVLIPEGLLLFALLFFSKTYADGHSMENTIQDKDNLLIMRHIPNYERGDIVDADIIDNETETKIRLLKRIIGVPGDTIKIKNNVLYVNGKKIEEEYIKEPMNTFDLEVTLKDKEYFLMGDNRNHSYDSRIHGVIKEEELRGKLIYHWN